MNFQAVTKSDLLIQLDLLVDQYHKVLESNSIEKLVFQPNGKWNISQNIDHINKSNRLTTIGYKTPKLLLRTFFGKPGRTSRSTEEIIRLYQAELKNGAKSSALFEAGKSGLKDKTILQEKYQAQITSLKSSIELWTEEDLDLYQMTHPILGKLTAKEMLSFTVYHQFHHMNTIQRILEKI